MHLFPALQLQDDWFVSITRLKTVESLMSTIEKPVIR